MDWETLIGSCSSLKELDNFFDLWAPIPSEFIGLAYDELCELSIDNFDQAAFDSLTFYYSELFAVNIQVSAFLFSFFYPNFMFFPALSPPPFPSFSFVLI